MGENKNRLKFIVKQLSKKPTKTLCVTLPAVSIQPEKIEELKDAYGFGVMRWG